MSDGIEVWDTESELLSGEYQPVKAPSAYRAQDFDHGGDWFHTAALALDYEQVPGKLAVVYDGIEPTEVVMAGWPSAEPCCPGGHSWAELEAAPVVAADPSAGEESWMCAVCGREAAPEVWHREAVVRLTPASPDGDDLGAGVEPEYGCGAPDGFAARAALVFNARTAQRAAAVDVAMMRANEDLDCVEGSADGRIEGVRVHVGMLTDDGWQQEMQQIVNSGDAVVLGVSGAARSGMVWLTVYGIHVVPVVGGHEARIEVGASIECSPAVAARAVMGSERIRAENARAVILARGEPAPARARSLRGAWQAISGCAHDEPDLEIVASEEAAEALLAEQRSRDEELFAARGAEPEAGLSL